MNIIEKIKKEPRIIIALINLICFFLPWINIVANISMEIGGVEASGDAGETASGFGIAEITPFSIVIYIIPVIIIILCLLDKFEDKKAFIYLGLSVVAIILMFVISGIAGNISMNVDMGGMGNASVKVGKLVGFWIALVCNAGIIVYTFVKDINLKSGQAFTDNIKNINVDNIASQVSEFAGDIQKNVKNAVMMECPHCHQQILPGKKFCPKCGGKIETNNSGNEKASQYNICLKCGSKIVKGKRFCEECGEPWNEKEEHRCPKCNTVIQPDKKFCGECGVPILKEQVSVERQQAEVCPNCGVKIENGKKFCGECGSKAE